MYDDALRYESDGSVATTTTTRFYDPEAKLAVAASREKRKPNFPGR